MSTLLHFGKIWETLKKKKKEYRSGLPFPSPGGLPNPGIEFTSLTSPALASRFFIPGATWEAQINQDSWPIAYNL